MRKLLLDRSDNEYDPCILILKNHGIVHRKSIKRDSKIENRNISMDPYKEHVNTIKEIGWDWTIVVPQVDTGHYIVKCQKNSK